MVFQTNVRNVIESQIALGDLKDVDTTASGNSPDDGEFLKYDASMSPPQWAPRSIALNDLSDVDAPAPSDGDVLTYDTSSPTGWKAQAPSGGGGGGPFRGALVKRSANGTGINFAGIALAWDAEEYDTDSIHDNVTNNSRLTVPPGVTKVRVGVGVQLNNVLSSAWLHLSIGKNGAGFPGQPNHTAGNTGIGNPMAIAWSPALEVTSGDYFTAHLNSSDTSADILANYSWFAMEIIE